MSKATYLQLTFLFIELNRCFFSLGWGGGGVNKIMNIFLLGQLQVFFEPVSSKRDKLASAPIKDSDQPVHPHSLIRVFNGRSMGSQGSSVSSIRKLRSECAD